MFWSIFDMLSSISASVLQSSSVSFRLDCSCLWWTSAIWCSSCFRLCVIWLRNWITISRHFSLVYNLNLLGYAWLEQYLLGVTLHQVSWLGALRMPRVPVVSSPKTTILKSSFFWSTFLVLPSTVPRFGHFADNQGTFGLGKSTQHFYLLLTSASVSGSVFLSVTVFPFCFVCTSLFSALCEVFPIAGWITGSISRQESMGYFLSSISSGCASLPQMFHNSCTSAIFV